MDHPQPAEQPGQRLVGSPLFSALKKVDSSFRLNKARPYQAINNNGYEVELLTAPSVIKTLCLPKYFRPRRSPSRSGYCLDAPCATWCAPVTARPRRWWSPIPAGMGLHKLWLAKKPTRRADKKDKDARQGELLLGTVARKMTSAYPMDVGFVLSLPVELLDEFNAWAARNDFVPGKDDARRWW